MTPTISDRPDDGALVTQAWPQDHLDQHYARLRLGLASTPANTAQVAPDGGRLQRAVRGIADDYMTSEAHHPGYVLIPTAKFDELLHLSLPNLTEGQRGELARLQSEIRRCDQEEASCGDERSLLQRQLEALFPTTFDEARIERRRADQNWNEADRLRGILQQHGVSYDDDADDCICNAGYDPRPNEHANDCPKRHSRNASPAQVARDGAFEIAAVEAERIGNAFAEDTEHPATSRAVGKHIAQVIRTLAPAQVASAPDRAGVDVGEAIDRAAKYVLANSRRGNASLNDEQVEAAKPRGPDGHHEMPRFSAAEIAFARAALATKPEN